MSCSERVKIEFGRVRTQVFLNSLTWKFIIQGHKDTL